MQLTLAQQGQCDPFVSGCIWGTGMRWHRFANCIPIWEPCSSTCTPEWGPCGPDGRQSGIDATCTRVTRTCSATCNPGCDSCKQDPARGGSGLWRRCWDQQCMERFEDCVPPSTDPMQCFQNYMLQCTKVYGFGWCLAHSAPACGFEWGRGGDPDLPWWAKALIVAGIAGLAALGGGSAENCEWDREQGALICEWD
jgi:hypothetical protein